MSSSDSDYSDEEEFEDIKKHFPSSEWDEFSSYDKRSYCNAAKNYEAMLKAGLNPRKPYFMLKDEEKNSLEQSGTLNPAKAKKTKEEVASLEPVRTSRRIHQRYHVEEEENVMQNENEDLLYCDECRQQWMGDCPHHGPLQVIQDTEVPDEAPDRAFRSLPEGLVLVRPAAKTRAKDKAKAGRRGVRTRDALPSRARFGPYEGDVGGTKTEEAAGNWMRHVETTEIKADANLRPFEYCGRLYFRTVCEVPAGTELVVFFANSRGDPGAECEHCGKHFEGPLLLAQHQRAATRCSAEARKQRRALVELRASMLPSKIKERERQQREQERQQREVERQRREVERELEEAREKQMRQLLEEQFEVMQRQKLESLVELEAALNSADAAQNGYVCKVCSKTFRRASLLRAHLETHADEQYLGCRECFLNPRHKQEHPNDFHNNAIFTCPSCHSKFPTTRELREHVVKAHFHLLKRRQDEAVDGEAPEAKAIKTE